MVEFKKNVSKVLPYNRGHYIDFLMDDDLIIPVKWYGVSFQLKREGNEMSLSEFIDKYEPWFKNLILGVDKGCHWIINHDKVDQSWFPNDQDNLIQLREIFRKNNVSNKFKGALIFSKDDLLEFSNDLISYPYSVFNKKGRLYSDIDISHNEVPFIIKISGHLNIDLLSTDIGFLREVVKGNSSSLFIMKEYRGTSL